MLIGFTFIFMVLLPDDFSINFSTFMKTIAMMIGELEYSDTFSAKTFAINLVFFIFVVIIPIIINNLLIGLTVDNVSELLTNAQFQSMYQKIKTIAQIEKQYFLRKVDSGRRRQLMNIKLQIIDSWEGCGETPQEVCIQPNNRSRTFFSDIDLTKVCQK